MKYLLIILVLLHMNTLSGQEPVGKGWKIGSFLTLYPGVIGVYFLMDSKTKKCQVGRDSIPISLDIDSGIYCLHKIFKNKIHLIEGESECFADKQRAKDARTSAHFYKRFKVESRSPNPFSSLKSDMSKERRAGRFARRYFHLANYIILEGFSDNFTTYYLVRDLRTNIKYYLHEECFNGKVTLYYYIEEDIEKLIKEEKKQFW